MASYQYIYVMKGLNKTWPGGKTVLNNVTLSFLPGAKIGVLGPNGAGKSTLLKMMAGMDTEFQGDAWAADGVKVGYLAQEPQLDPEKTVFENIMDGMGEVKTMIDRFNAIGAEMGDPDADMDSLMAEMGELQEKSMPPMVGKWNAPSKWQWTRCAVPPKTPTLHRYRVGRNAGSRSPVYCWKNPICYCSMNRPTISTRKASGGCSAISMIIRVRW